MGCYDSVLFQCPRCDKEIEVQSKAGECAMSHISPSEVPVVIAKSIEGETVRCPQCHHMWSVVAKIKVDVIPMGLA